MIYRRLGRTGLKVSVLGIGGGAFFGKDKPIWQITQVLKTSIKKGINLIETAEDYDETKLTSGLAGLRKNVILASKSFASDKDGMKRAIRNSLKKLQTDHIEIYMIHTVTTANSLEFKIKNGVLDALEEAKKEGIIDFIGITGHRIPPLIEALKTDKFDVVEAPYGIGAFETEKLFEVTMKHDIGVLCIRALGGGILVDPSKFINTMNAENALRYVLSNKNVSSALIGMSSPSHVEENLKVIKKGMILSQYKKKQIEKNVENLLGHNFCRGCLACMPCEKHGWKFGIDQFLRMSTFYSNYRIKSILQDYRDLQIKANECTACGKCEALCPYNVPIIKKLTTLHKSMLADEK